MKRNILISRCLLGDNVVWHGGRRNDEKEKLYTKQKPKNSVIQNFVRHNNTRYNIISFCPEVDALKLPVPRPPLRIVVNRDYNGDTQSRKWLLQKQHVDANEEKIMFSRDYLFEAFEREFFLKWDVASVGATRIHGFISKARSPMCGHGNAREYFEKTEECDEFMLSRKDVDGGFAEWIREKYGENVVIANEKELKNENDLNEFLQRVDEVEE